MNDFVEFLAKKKASHYYDLYKSGKQAERKEECLNRVKMIDEYVLLLEIIEYLPPDVKTKADELYKEFLEEAEVFHN